MLGLFPLCMSVSVYCVFTSGCVTAQSTLPSDDSRLFPHSVQSVVLLVGNLLTVLLMSAEMKDEACSVSRDISVGHDNQTHPSPLQVTLS